MKKIFLIGLITIALFISLDFMVFAEVDDYPIQYKYYSDGTIIPRDAVVDEWNFYNRECTSFVAWRLNNNNGVNFTNQYKGASQWGHAKYWGIVAKSLGIVVNNTPSVGSVAWWNTGDYGHVAWVEDVQGSSVIIEEYNYTYIGDYSRRTISESEPTGYIHIKDLKEELTIATPAVTVVNGKIFMSWNATENAHSYNIRIRNSDGTPYKDIWNVIETSLQTVLPMGSYRVYVDAVNSYATNASNTITFTVSENYTGPSESNLSVNISDNIVHLSWSEATNAQIYNIRIYHSDGTDYTVWNQTGTSCDITLPLGTYKAYVDSCNNVDVTKGKTIQFTVISHTNTSYFYAFEDVSIIQDNFNYIINFEIKKLADYSKESNVYVCIYDKNGTFTGLCSSKVNSEGNYSLDITDFYKNNAIIKLFLWDNTMIPLSQSKTI